MFSFGVCVFLLESSRNDHQHFFAVTASLIRSELQKLHSRFHSSANQKKKRRLEHQGEDLILRPLFKGDLSSQNSDSESPTEKKTGNCTQKKSKIGPAKLLVRLQDEDQGILFIDTKIEILYHQTWHQLKQFSLAQKCVFVPSYQTLPQKHLFAKQKIYF